MSKTYGEFVAGAGLTPKDEKAVRQVYALIPLSGTIEVEDGIRQHMPEQARERVAHYIELLKDAELISTGGPEPPKVWRNIHTYKGEKSLYPHMRAEIRTRWADESPHYYTEPDRFCEVLATHGQKGGGRWAAPDITLIGGKTLPHLPGKFLDVVTFEVKSRPGLDITGLYEALSHRAHATHAYLICHHPASRGEPDAREVARITREAARTGVGVIVARQPDDYATWQEIAPAARWTPDPELLHNFIARLGKLDRNALRRLRQWLRLDPFLGTRPPVDFTTLGLSEEDQTRAEDIYMEIPLSGKGVGWPHFAGWIDKSDVERIRQRLKKARIIQVVQKGGMKLPGR